LANWGGQLDTLCSCTVVHITLNGTKNPKDAKSHRFITMNNVKEEPADLVHI